MRNILVLVSKLLNRPLSLLDNFQPYNLLKQYIWDKWVNNQETLVIEGIQYLSTTVQTLVVIPETLEEEFELDSLYHLEGSDKSSRHNYHQIYAPLLKGLHGNVLEVGIGSESSFSYASGRPGGSLRAMKTYQPAINIFGADIDENSISKTDFPAWVVDQTSTESLENLNSEISTLGDFSLIIDDGFHEFSANVRTFLALSKRLNSGGHYFVEDVHQSQIALWTIFLNNLKQESEIIDLRHFRKGVKDNILIHVKF